MESQFVVLNMPFFRQVKKFPFTAAFITSVVMTVSFFPAAVALRRIPDYLRIQAYKQVFSPAFQFFSGRGINDFIIFPVFGYPHRQFPFFAVYRFESSCHAAACFFVYVLLYQ